jgi:hypothetical protein
MPPVAMWEVTWYFPTRTAVVGFRGEDSEGMG